MSNNEPDAADDSHLTGEGSRTVRPGRLEKDSGSGWENRKTVLARIFHGSLSTGAVRKRPWNPGLWNLNNHGLLAILRAEAFRVKAEPAPTEPTGGVQPDTSAAERQVGDKP